MRVWTQLADLLAAVPVAEEGFRAMGGAVVQPTTGWGSARDDQDSDRTTPASPGAPTLRQNLQPHRGDRGRLAYLA